MVFMMFYAAFKGLPKEYSEAVYIDGGGEFTLYYMVMLPFVVPTFIALFIINAIGCWNGYQFVMLYLPSYPTLATGLFLGKMEFVRGEGGEPVYYAAILLTSLPMAIMYALSSNIILKNFTVGGLKG
jgi:ABC-type glycerol-3-phosphate transport system permease component